VFAQWCAEYARPLLLLCDYTALLSDADAVFLRRGMGEWSVVERFFPHFLMSAHQASDHSECCEGRGLIDAPDCIAFCDGSLDSIVVKRYANETNEVIGEALDCFRRHPTILACARDHALLHANHREEERSAQSFYLRAPLNP
jgi:hypothetical protein